MRHDHIVDPEVDVEQDDRTGLRTSHFHPRVFAAIAAGSALGAPARYGIAQLVHSPGNGFPLATFATNLSGSFVLGLLLVLILERFPATRYVRPFLATGFIGAYTTYSTFAVESDLLVKNGHASRAAVYALATIAGGLLAAFAGITAGRALPVRPLGGAP